MLVGGAHVHPSTVAMFFIQFISSPIAKTPMELSHLKLLEEASIFDQDQFDDDFIARKAIFPLRDCLQRAQSLFHIGSK
jgi:hypothetical protein